MLLNRTCVPSTHAEVFMDMAAQELMDGDENLDIDNLPVDELLDRASMM